MKILILLVTIIVSSCSSALQSSLQYANNENLVEEYFPFNDHVTYYYDINKGSDEAVVNVEYVHDDKIQISVKTTQLSFARIYEKEKNSIFIVNEDILNYSYHYDFTREMTTKREEIFRIPHQASLEWVGEGRRYELKETNEIWKYGDKEYACIELLIKDNSNKTIKEYYVPHFGLVKKISSEGMNSTFIELKRVEDKNQKNQMIEFYIPNILRNSEWIKKKQAVEFINNASVEKIFAESYSDLMEQTKAISYFRFNILSIDVLKEQNYCHIDFSSDFLDAIKGLYFDDQIIIGIGKTLSEFYQVRFVSYSVEGGAFKSSTRYYNIDEKLNMMQH